MDELASSLGKVIPIASAYGVQMDNLSSAYALLTKGGIATAEATTYLKSMLNELGDSGSEVGIALTESTGKTFSQLSAEGKSLGDVIGILGEAAGGSAEALQQMFSSQEAGIGALALYNAGAQEFNATLGEMQNSAGATADAYDILNNTTADAIEDMMTSFDNFGIALGRLLGPAVQFFAGIITDVMNGLTDFLNWCADAAEAVFGVSKEFNDATPAAKQYSEAVTELEEKQRALAESGQEESAAYAEVTGQLAEARGEYELMYQTMDAYQEQVDSAVSSANDFAESCREQMTELAAAPAKADAYISRINELANKQNRTAGESQLLQGLLTQLNSTYPELAATVDDFTGATDRSAESIREQIEAANNTSKLEAYFKLYEEGMNKMAELDVERSIAQEQLAIAEERFAKADWWGQTFGEEKQDLDAMREAVEDLDTAYADVEDRVGVLDGLIQETSASMNNLSDSAEGAADAMEQVDEGTAAGAQITQELTGRIGDLCTAYDEAYNAALESFEGQFGLFDDASEQVKALADATTQDLQAALDSQLQYWTQMSANIDTVSALTAEQIGVTQEAFDAAMPAIQSDAEATAAIASAIQNGNTEVVADTVNKMAEVAAARQEAADSQAEWASGFTQGIQDVQTQMNEMVASMDSLSAESQGKAQEFINNYIAGINSAGPGMKTAAHQHADAAAQDIIQSFNNAASNVDNYCAQMTSAIDGLPTSKTFTYTIQTVGSVPNMSGVPGHARGTRFSLDDIYIAGEEGPELIVGGYGSRVYTAAETSDIMDAMDELSRMGRGSTALSSSGMIDDFAAKTRQAQLDLGPYWEPNENISAAPTPPSIPDPSGTGHIQMPDLNVQFADSVMETAEDAMSKVPAYLMDKVKYIMDTARNRMEMEDYGMSLGPYREQNPGEFDEARRQWAMAEVADPANRTEMGWLTALIHAVRVDKEQNEPYLETLPTLPDIPYTAPEPEPVSAGPLDLGENWMPNAPSEFKVEPNAGIMLPSGQMSGGSGEQTLAIKFDANGKIGYSKGLSRDEIAESMSQEIQAQVKPALLRILKEEAVEEGDGAYVY